MHSHVLQLAGGIVHLLASASVLAMTHDKRRRLAIQVSFIDVELRHGTQEEVGWEEQKMTKQQANKTVPQGTVLFFYQQKLMESLAISRRYWRDHVTLYQA